MTAHARRAVALASLCFGSTFSLPASADGGAASTLLPGDVLFAGQGLVSDTCYYHLDMQSDGNLVVYAGAGNSASQAVWNSHQATYYCDWASAGCFYRFNLPVGGVPYTTLQTDGNFVEYEESGGYKAAIWSSNTAMNAYSEVWMQADGNLVVYPASSLGSNAWWWTGTHGNESGPNSCPMTSRITQMLPNTDLLGDDFAHGCTNDEMQCGQWCADYAGTCAAWTWTPPGAAGSCSASEGQCFLKSSVPRETYDSGMVSGIIDRYTP